jgi:glutathionylspermidine synthase
LGRFLQVYKGRREEDGESDYGKEGYIYQSLEQLPRFEDNYTVIGSWLVGDEPPGIALWEDKNLVTKEMSRFLPHIIVEQALLNSLQAKA